MKKDIVIAVVAAVIVLAVAFGLSQLRPNVPGTASKTSAANREIGKDEKVVMHVNGEPLTDKDFDAFAATVPEQQRAFYATPSGKRALADEIARVKALEQEAAKVGLEKDPAIQQQIAMARSQILAGKMLEKLADDKIDEKVRVAYEKEKGNAMSLRHIVVAYQGGQVPARGGKPAPTEAAAMQRAQSIAAKLRGGADFGRTAQAESDDEQSAQKGGTLGPVRPESLPPDIAAIVSKLQPGQMSDPVKTEFGVHIFKVEQPSLEQLTPMLRQRVRQETAESEMKRLHSGAKIDLDPVFFPPAPAAPTQGIPGAPKSQG